MNILIGEYFCHICYAKLPSKARFKFHLIKHEDKNASVTYYKCLVCVDKNRTKYPSLDSVKNHLKSMHDLSEEEIGNGIEKYKKVRKFFKMKIDTTFQEVQNFFSDILI